MIVQIIVFKKIKKDQASVRLYTVCQIVCLDSLLDVLQSSLKIFPQKLILAEKSFVISAVMSMVFISHEIDGQIEKRR